MLITTLLVLLGLCATSDAAVAAAGHRFLLDSTGADEAAALNISELVIVYTTTVARLPLVHATRPARRGIRTFIVLQNASEVARLNELYGGINSEYNETYLAWVDPARSDGGSGGPYGRNPLPPRHPLHTIGPAWAVAPLIVHSAVLAASSSTPPAATSAPAESVPDGAEGATAATAAAAPPPPPYRWMLVARDDTLWRPRQAVRLLSQYDAGVAAAVSDHFLDFNGRRLLAPSAAAAVCLPCGMNLTALLGRRHPPGVPQPGCRVCRPAIGCEFRFNLCDGLAGGPHCATKRFLGSGDRCSYSWVAGGAGVALSVTLLGYLDQEDWVSCVRAQRPSTGERSLGRCLSRNGFSFTHPAAALAEGLSREVFSERHMLFGNPALRQVVFGAEADSLLGPVYKAQEEEAAAKAAAKAAKAAAASAVTAKVAAPSAMMVAAGADSAAAAAAISLPASTRVRSAVAAAGVAAAECDEDCRRWLDAAGVSVHLDVPYANGAAAVDVVAAAALMAKAAEEVAKGSKK